MQQRGQQKSKRPKKNYAYCFINECACQIDTEGNNFSKSYPIKLDSNISEMAYWRLPHFVRKKFQKLSTQIILAYL